METKETKIVPSLQNNSMSRCAVILTYRWGIWGKERFSNLSKVSQLVKPGLKSRQCIEIMLSCPGPWLWAHHTRPPPIQATGVQNSHTNLLHLGKPELSSFQAESALSFLSPSCREWAHMLPLTTCYGFSLPHSSKQEPHQQTADWVWPKTALIHFPVHWPFSQRGPVGTLWGCEGELIRCQGTCEYAVPIRRGPAQQKRGSWELRQGLRAQEPALGSLCCTHWGGEQPSSWSGLRKGETLTIKLQRTWESKGRKQKEEESRKSGAKVFSSLWGGSRVTSLELCWAPPFPLMTSTSSSCRVQVGP